MYGWYETYDIFKLGNFGYFGLFPFLIRQEFSYTIEKGISLEGKTWPEGILSAFNNVETQLSLCIAPYESWNSKSGNGKRLKNENF